MKNLATAGHGANVLPFVALAKEGRV